MPKKSIIFKILVILDVSLKNSPYSQFMPIKFALFFTRIVTFTI